MKPTIHIAPDQLQHIITYKDGSKREARLFYPDGKNVLCELNKYSRQYGHPLDTKNVISIEPKDMWTYFLAKTRRFVNRVCELLEQSGLFPDFLHDFRIVQSLNDVELRRLLVYDYEEYNDEWAAWTREIGLNHWQCGVDNLFTTVRIGIKSINYKADEKERVSHEFAEAIVNKRSYDYSWRKGYDNTISCSVERDTGIPCAFYSEEFKGMGNGHYYFAIDATHAIFDQND